MAKQKNKLMLIVSIVLFVSIVLLFSIALLKYYPYWFGLEKRTFYASVYVNESSGGFDLNATALTFGKIRAGLEDTASRGIMFDNKYDFPVIAIISSEGEISPLLNYEKEVYVAGGESIKIGFSVSAKNDTLVGFYDGYVKIKVVPAV